MARRGASFTKALGGVRGPSFRRAGGGRNPTSDKLDELAEENKADGRKSFAGGRRSDMTMEEEELKAIFMLRLKYGIPVLFFQGKLKRNRSSKKAELVSETDGRTLSVRVVDGERYQELVSASKRLMEEHTDVLSMAAAIPEKRREVSMTSRQEKNSALNLRTVDIKEIWQAEVENTDIKHTIIDWPDGTTLDLEAVDKEEAAFLERGLGLCLEDWTQHTSEYSDFWDSM